MNQRKHILTHGLILGFSTSIVGCSLLDFSQPQATSLDQASPDAVTSPSAQPETVTSPQPSEAATPFTVITAPGLQPPPETTARESYACLTANYFTEITWQQDQPQMSFGRKPAELTFSNEVANVKGNADGSFTYQLAKEDLFYTRVYPDRSCFVQVVTSNNIPIVEENGKLGELISSQTNTKSTESKPSFLNWMRQWTIFPRSE